MPPLIDPFCLLIYTIHIDTKLKLRIILQAGYYQRVTQNVTEGGPNNVIFRLLKDCFFAQLGVDSFVKRNAVVYLDELVVN